MAAMDPRIDALSREQRDETDYRETLAIVGDQARRLGRLVDNMLVLARADAGGYPLRPVDLYFDEVVAECCRALHVLSTERRVALTLGESPEIPFRGDDRARRNPRRQAGRPIRSIAESFERPRAPALLRPWASVFPNPLRRAA